MKRSLADHHQRAGQAWESQPYVRRSKQRLEGCRHPAPLLEQSKEASLAPATIRRAPALTVRSGPAAGWVGAR